MSEDVTKYIVREFPSRVEVSTISALSSEMQVLYDTSNHSQRIKYAHQKQKEVDEARELYMQGNTVSEIGKIMHHIPKTIQNYLYPSYSIVRPQYDSRVPVKLAPYEKQVLELRSQGYTYQRMHDIISEYGYNGSVASLRMFVQKERAHVKRQFENLGRQKQYVQRKI